MLYFVLLYTPTPLHFGEKHCPFYSTTSISSIDFNYWSICRPHPASEPKQNGNSNQKMLNIRFNIDVILSLLPSSYFNIMPLLSIRYDIWVCFTTLISSDMHLKYYNPMTHSDSECDIYHFIILERTSVQSEEYLNLLGSQFELLYTLLW